MDQLPRELHFSHDNTQFRAILVDNILGSSLSDEECCICGYELNNLAYYTTEPPLFHAHVACVLHHPDVHDTLAKNPPSNIRDRSLFTALFPSNSNNPPPPLNYAHSFPPTTNYVHGYGPYDARYAPHYGPYHAYAHLCPTNYVPSVYGQNPQTSCSFPNKYPQGNGSSGSSSGKIIGAVAKGALRVFLQVLIVTVVAVIL